MLLLLVLVFVGVFVVLALLLVASGTGATQQTKRTLAVLRATLATAVKRSEDPVVDLRRQELLSAVPWINRWLSGIELAPRLRTILYQADVKWTVGGLLLVSAAGFVLPAYLVELWTRQFFISVLIGLLLGAAPLVYVLTKRRRRFAKFEAGLPEAIDLMVSALRAGHSLNAALGLVANETPDPVGTEFRICFEEQNYGLELRTALDNLTMRVPLQDLRMVSTAVLIQKESGGNLAEVLDKTAHVIRERFRLRREVRTYTAQGRLTGWILSLLPLVLGIAIYMVNPQTMSLLWRNPIGVKFLYLSAIMTVAGALIIRKIIRIDI